MELLVGAAIFFAGILIGTFCGFVLAAFGVAVNERNRMAADLSRRVAETMAQRQTPLQHDADDSVRVQ